MPARERASIPADEGLFRQISKGVQEAVLIMDQEARCVFANEAVCNLLGRSQAELRGLPLADLFAPEEASSNLIQFRESLQGIGRLRRLVNLPGKDGVRTEVDLNAVLLPNGLIYVSCRDPSSTNHEQVEQIRLEGQIRHAQRLESLGALAGGIAHDFNNLLMVITGNLDLAMAGLPAASRIREAIGNAMNSAQRAADLTRQMLIYAGKSLFIPEPTDLTKVVQEIGGLLRSSVSKGIELSLDLDPELPVIKGDKSQIRQALINLVANSSEAIGESMGSIWVRTRAETLTSTELKGTRLEYVPPDGSYVRLEVSDSGSGMSDDVKRRLFEPFFTTKFTGRGLGMAAVAGIVRGHGGAIFLESTLGQGSRISLLLPTMSVAVSPIEAAIVAKTEQLPQLLHGTILLADDEDSVRHVARLMLEDWGLEVITANDGEEAVEVFRARAQDIDLVILDLTMPKLNGEAVFSMLREQRPDIQVILSSGYSERDATKNIPVGKLAGFLQKPYRLPTLKRAVAKALKQGGE